MGKLHSSVSGSQSVARAWLVEAGELKHAVATLSGLGLAHPKGKRVSLPAGSTSLTHVETPLDLGITLFHQPTTGVFSIQ